MWPFQLHSPWNAPLLVRLLRSRPAPATITDVPQLDDVSTLDKGASLPTPTQQWVTAKMVQYTQDNLPILFMKQMRLLAMGLAGQIPKGASASRTGIEHGHL
jgi:hypothetical protein